MSIALSGVGVGFAGGLILIFFTLFPQFQPGYTVFTVSMGDIFFNQAQWVKPPENPNEILATYWIGWDENGFRIPARQSETYPILALGDSFTEAPNVARPWTDVLAANRNQAVQNMAYRGFGPAEYVRVLERLAARSEVETVIIGFFEGNDLSNALSSRDTPVDMPWEILAEDRRIIQTDVAGNTEERYPMQATMNGSDHDIAFFEPYAWVLNANRSDYRRSLNLALTMQSFNAVRTTLPDACVIIAYFPAKPHIYLPYLKPEDQAILMQKAERFNAVQDEPLRLTPVPDMPFDDLLKNLPNLRDAVKAEVEAARFPFFDLTPVLEAAAAEGQMLYYTYDTHWNQAGHDLVGEAIADFLATTPCS